MNIERNWKYYLGVTLFCYSFLPYIIALLLLFFRIPLGSFISVAGLFIVSAEISFTASAALLGRQFIELLKSKLKSLFLRPKEVIPLKYVSKTRHYTGIILLLISFLPYFIAEICLFLGYPKTDAGHMNLFFVMLSGDAIFIISLFVLGGEFWDRLKNLFQWQKT